MIEVIENATVSEIVMGNPPVNAIDNKFMSDFHAALDRVEEVGATVMLIRSNQKVFCAGADLKSIQQHFQTDSGIDDMITYVQLMHKLFNRLEQFPAVTIAAINGAALGGGLELALSCDLRVAASEAKLGLPEAQVGMIPGAGGTQRLTRLCGPGIASRIILGCETVDGVEAVRIGLVEKNCPRADIDIISREWADRIGKLAKPALLASKECIYAYSDSAIDGYALELEKPRITMRSQEAQDRIVAFFSK
ncbi:enoyl-CoA hydratase/isomerase family protein [Sneathiella sp.]|uniref:enoyl-CoA hydratase/isomerase family protein n=1 Tax=Sneathiella sp. TaxID=1964365 RepID=UPI00262AC3AC|nr:enoyl-CoA hydratase/isomerase family protein [Sneathiella sp.]MDF2367127.1 enoyl-CoA hydratase/isomerase family protein [Sneathiella sp.]